MALGVSALNPLSHQMTQFAHMQQTACKACYAEVARGLRVSKT